MLEIVEVVGFLRGKDATADCLGIEAGDVEIDGLILVETDVGDSKNDRTVLGLCG